MKCPYCGFEESKVIDTRSADDGDRIKRRRECLSCMKRFTTFESVEASPIIVVKKDNSRELFNRSKLFNGILKACEKRPISIDIIEDATNKIESKLQNTSEREIPSYLIGEYAMQALKDIDEIAYVRFASVYKQFKDIDTFMKELSTLLKHKEE